MSSDSAPRHGRRFILIMTGIGVLIGGAIASSIAYALWSVSGSGESSDQVITADDLVLTANASPAADLFPGGTGAAQFTVENPNPFPVQVTALQFGAVTSSAPTACPASNLATTNVTLGTPIAVPADGTSPAQSVGKAFTLATNAPNGCQGVTFTVATTATGTQVAN